MVGERGGARCARCCRTCARSSAPDFVVANGENAAGGIGITPKEADELFGAGVDVITLGNHTYRHREVWPYLDSERRDRAAVQLPADPARPRDAVVERDGSSLGVVNLSGTVHLQAGSAAARGRRRGAARGSGADQCSSTCTPS